MQLIAASSLDGIEERGQMKAFVIGPIGDKDAPDGSTERAAFEEGIQVFEEVIEPACNGFGLEVERADMISRSGEIPEQIFRHLRDCPVVIADLTSANPNVMYELGLRHTTGKVTIQIGERGRLPFDISSIRTIMFRRSDAGLVQARKDLAKSLAANLDSGGDPVTATRVWFEASSTVQDNSGDDASAATDQEDEFGDDGPGFLELLADMEVGIQSLTQTMGAASSIIEAISIIYNDGTESVRKADERGGGAAARLTIAEQIASRLGKQAARLEVVAGEYAQTVDRIEPGLTFLLQWISENPKQLEELPEFPEQLRKLCEAAQSSIAGTLSMKNNALEIGKASRSLKRVGQRLVPSFSRFAEASTRVAGWHALLNSGLRRDAAMDESTA